MTTATTNSATSTPCPGNSNATAKGAIPPETKLSADAAAACTGLAALTSVSPSSSRAWASSASLRVSASATLRASDAATALAMPPMACPLPSTRRLN